MDFRWRVRFEKSPDDASEPHNTIVRLTETATDISGWRRIAFHGHLRPATPGAPSGVGGGEQSQTGEISAAPDRLRLLDKRALAEVAERLVIHDWGADNYEKFPNAAQAIGYLLPVFEI
uniref:Uncharacterized protein n=1 Tax=Oryza punctata TaxID=4537 RepID=A0A0E0LR68_ORYPU